MAPTAANNTNGLSKSQKKRMKQKAAKAKKEAEQKKQNDGTPNELVDKNPASLNPHEKLCYDLTQRGYELPEIEKALEEMWNFGMQYDDFYAALAYLEGKKAQKEADAQKELAAKAAANRIENAIAVNTPSPTPSVSTDESAEKSDDKNEADTAILREQETEETGSVVESESAPTAPSSLSGSESLPRPTDLASKLDIAAKYENLKDAVVALAEWVNKAAKPPQLMSLCTIGRAARRPALYTIIKRVIECKSDSDFESVLSIFLTLSSGIFIKSMNKPNAEGNSSLSDTLKYVRDAMRITMEHQSNEIDSAFIANSMVESVADKITESFKVLVSHESPDDKASTTDDLGDVVETIQKMEQEIESILSQQPGYNGGGVLELMSRRDCRKTAAEKSGAVANLVLASDRNTPIENASPKEHLSQEDDVSLLSNLFGGQLHSFQKSRTVYNKLESRLNSLNASWIQERNQLTTHIDSCQEDLDRIEVRREQLQKELDLLNAESSRVSTRQNMLKERMEAIFNSSSTPEIDSMKVELKSRAEMMKVEDKVTGVLEKLSSVDESFTDETTPSGTEKARTLEFDPSQVQTKMESFLILAKNYFVTEAECVSFMQNRVSKMQHDAKDLQREIAECTALGMATNVSKMANSLDVLNRNIMEDEGVISLLRSDAEKMRDDIIERAKDYSASGNTITSSQDNLLKTLGLVMTRVGIKCNNPIFSQTQENNIVKEKQSKSNGFHPEQIVPPPGMEAAAPNLKLSWASSASSKSQVKKSLVDIQREELSRKIH